jgi:hypothetical protein
MFGFRRPAGTDEIEVLTVRLEAKHSPDAPTVSDTTSIAAR